MGIVQARLEELGEKYGDIFMLRFYEGYSESEIARRLELNVATVKTRAYRARLAVRERLAEQMQHAA
jgi:RNA polymerase sigma factor (sigma-70 family)